MARLFLRDLTPGTNYKIQLRAVEGDSVSEWSRLFDLTTIFDTTKPNVPTNVTWVWSGDTFHGEWDAVTQNLKSENVTVTRYDVELVAGGLTKYVSVPQSTGRVVFDLPFEANRALFGTPKGAIVMRVRAVDSKSLFSDWTGPITATNPPPQPVTNLTADPIMDGISLKWTAPADLDLAGYNIYINSVTGINGTKINSKPLTDTNFIYATTTYAEHFFRVTAVDVYGQESTPVEVSATPNSPFLVDTEPPAEPTNLVAEVENNANGIGAYALVSWTHTTENDLAGFNLRYQPADAQDNNWTSLTLSRDDRLVKVELPLASTGYDFQIRSFDWTANYSDPVQVTSNIPVSGAPTTITDLPTMSAGRESITVGWVEVPDADLAHYRVEIAEDNAFITGLLSYNTAANSLTVSALDQNVTYYARVKAVNNAGLLSDAWSPTASATTGVFPTGAASDDTAPAKPAAPSLLGGFGNIYASWAPVTTNAVGEPQNDAVTYEVYISTSSTGNFEKVTETSGAFALLEKDAAGNGLVYGQPYYIKIVAKDRDGASDLSDVSNAAAPVKASKDDIVSVNADVIQAGAGILQNLIIGSGGGIQSAVFDATQGFKLNDTGLTIRGNSVVAVEAVQGGTISAKTINIGPGGLLNIDSTGVVKSNNWSTGATGWRLDSAGLEVNEGSVAAKTLKSGLISTATLELSGANGVIQTAGYTGTSGFKLSGTGLEIKTGAIEAAALKIQQGNNLIPAAYADFEGNPSWYSMANGTLGGGNVTLSIDTANVYMNKQSLKIVTTDVANSVYMGKGSAEADFNMWLQPSTSYICSFYAMIPVGAVATTARPAIRFKSTTAGTPVHVTGTTASIPADGVWRRYSAVIAAPATAVGPAIFNFQSFAALTTIYVDGIQVEQKIGSINTPSNWAPPGGTSIDGSLIRTGAIQSTNYTGAANQPQWAITMGGAATFTGMQVLGNTVLGKDVNDTASLLSSSNYKPGTDGWQLRGDGTGDLRGLQADSINGKSITATTLSATSFTDSPLDARITLRGSLEAEGDRGETVLLGAAGFQVWGAHETPVISKSMTGGIVTLTTSVAHGYSATDPADPTKKGTVIVSNVGTPFPSEPTIYTILDVPSTTTFRISGFTGADFAATAVTGLVQGKDVTGQRDKPLYIDFPTDGAKPNIISGVLTASTMVVTSGATFRGISGIEPGATMTIASSILAPKTAPLVSVTYNDTPISGVPGTTILGTTKGHNGNIFVASNGNTGGGKSMPRNNNYVSEHDAATGKLIAVRVTRENSITNVEEFNGITYFNNFYYILLRTTHPNGSTDQALAYNTSWGYLAATVVGFYDIGDTVPTGLTIGPNYTNNRLIYATCYSGANPTMQEYGIVADGTVGTTSGVAIKVAGVTNYSTLAGVARGVFGYAASDRYILRTRHWDSARTNYWVTDTAGTSVPAEHWPAATGPIWGFWWDSANSKFYDISASKVRREYQNGDSFWTTGTGSRFVGYSWYDPDTAGSVVAATGSATHETDLSPRVQFVLPKRGQMSVTIAPIPKGIGSDTPTQARIYVAAADTDPGAASSVYKHRVTIAHPLTSAKVNPLVINAIYPKATNEFGGSSTPGIIQSTSGKSFWKGDDTAQFYSLVLQAGTDVTMAQDNTPALRIGDPAGAHMRLDNNEIQGIVKNATSGLLEAGPLYLNAAGGGAVRIGMNSRNITAIRWGVHTGNSNASGQTTTNHGLGITPDIVIVTPLGAGTARSGTFLQSSTNATSFLVEHRKLSDGTLLASAVADFAWIAIG